ADYTVRVTRDFARDTRYLPLEAERPLPAEAGALPAVVLSGPVFDPDEYGCDLRSLVQALDDLGCRLRLEDVRWSESAVEFEEEKHTRLQDLTWASLEEGERHVHVWDTPPP